jgi:membrane-associated protease RseP (regulator of RpoE activity)
MFNIKEGAHILIAIILFAFVISFLQPFNQFAFALIVAFIILVFSIGTKKITAYILDADIDHKIWLFQRWGYYKRSYFPKPIPMGIILPFLGVWLSYPSGILKILTFLQFDVKSKTERVSKRYGNIRTTEMTDFDISIIAFVGIISCLVLSIIAYFINQPLIAKFSIYYALWNLIPISQLDGTKLFFGSRILWIIAIILTIIATALVLFYI